MNNIESFPIVISDIDNSINIDFVEEDATIKVETTKLVLSKETIKALDAKSGDRIAINYWTESPELTFPLIGKAEWFTDNTDGNRLTKSNTVSFRGTQNNVLREYGDFFKIEPFKRYYKMVPIKELLENDSLKEEEQYLKKLQ